MVSLWEGISRLIARGGRKKMNTVLAKEFELIILLAEIVLR